MDNDNINDDCGAVMKVAYNSYMKEIMADIKKSEKKYLTEAAKHVQKKMKEKVGKKLKSRAGAPPGVRSGKLKKGIKYLVQDNSALVGLGPPAHHGHLLEFGTVSRTTKKGANKGMVAARPFLRPTFEEESDAVRNILTGQSWA